MSLEETADGTRGEWKEDKPQEDDIATLGYGGGEETPGIVCIDESLPPSDLVANMAHELGHACTDEDDLEARGSCLEDEWASELTADWYADRRWGFSAEINSRRDERDDMHHGPRPGTSFFDGQSNYYIDDDYVCHELP